MFKTHLNTFREIANLPTAPFVEDHVIDYVRGFVAQRPQLRVRADRFGNLLVKYTPRTRPKAGPTGRPILFAAHMDHPGFIARNMIDAKHLQAEWRGGVQARYFKDERIRFFADGRWIHATIEEIIHHKSPKPTKRPRPGGVRPSRADSPPKAVIAKVGEHVPPGSPGMWDIKDAVIRGHRIHARVCDDLAGVAAIICMLDTICRKKIKTSCYGFFSRAEEVGFAGALAAVEARTIPQRAIVVAVECSKALPGVAELGNGPVLRVGDKMTIFTPGVTAYCRAVAEKLAEEDKTFRFQRKLMDGGSCESTAYCHYGYEANGICLPMVNYHNMDPDNRKIAPESVDTRDFVNLVKWFVALAESPTKIEFDGRHPGLDKKLDTLRRRHRRRLLKTAAS
ncbi:MAG: hypothetical protein JXQ75_13870 [Phycisphaerae bacterium]|nr:hypothetical protein [Phycisphaerae bacterium]